jgi:response regulator RpfG family c-di-GMP phosphodiesterase
MRKILVVNNDIDGMSLLQKWLERKEYEVKYTSNGDEVSHLMKTFKPHLVLVDVLQDKVVEQIKTDEHTKEIPVILMTGYTISKQSIEATIADDVIEKPFNPKLLEKKIESFLKKTG